MNRRSFLGLGLPAAAGIGCSRRAAAPFKMRVSATRRVFNAGLFTAQEMGFFGQMGLEVEIVPDLGRSEMIPLVAGGQVDVVSSPIGAATVNAVAKGVSMRIVAGRGVQAPNCGTLGTFYCRKDSFPKGLTDLRMLRGKRIDSRGPGGISDFFIGQMLESAGLTIEDMDVRRLSRQESIAALLGGGLDLILEYEADRRLTEVSDAIFVGPDLGALLPNFQFSFLYFGKRLIEADPGHGANFLAAYIRGVRAFVAGANPKWLDDYAREFKIDVAGARSQCRRFLTVNAEIDMKSLTRFVDWSVKRRYCPPTVSAQQMVDTRYLERAWKLVGRQG